MIEVLIKIKEMIKNNENNKAIEYIDKVLKENKNANTYIEDLVNELK